ncbi:MAG: methionyl-tRNA formyltransferase [Erysipelothrix sp.]|nr:methionyl-tRNA formyltransferase [Erysipelothrix sp.]
MKFRVIYMGTPSFASEVLSFLVKQAAIDIVGVVTQPDRLVGRKKKLVYSEVKQTALDHQFLLFQPEKISHITHQLSQLKADAIITCAYGQFLPETILKMTPSGVINIHASLLPKYRGGAPMQQAIRNGETETGITLMKSAKKMDAGDIFSQLKVTIDPDETLTSLELKLIQASKQIVQRDLLSILNGRLKPVAQDSDLATFAPIIKAEDELIDMNQPGQQIYNQIRSLIDNPYAYAYLDGKKIKICRAKYQEDKHSHPQGQIVSFDKDQLVVAVSGGLLLITELQIAGKEKMSVTQLYPGYHQQWQGQRFTSNEG